MKPHIDIGDLNAPEGSTPWCQGWLQVICRLKREGQSTISMLKLNLRKFRNERLYERLPDDNGETFRTWEDFVQYREPYGLGMRVDVANAVIEERDDSRLVSEFELRDNAGRPEGPYDATINPDNVRIKYGNNKAYTLARLKRDFPNLYAAVLAGELSANAAAIQAGFRKKPVKCCPNCGHTW